MKFWTATLLSALISTGCLQGRAAQASAANTNRVDAQAPPVTQWTRFDDPNEKAFYIDVPAGWKTEGGLVRRNAIDYSMFLRVLSPDASILLILGDPGPGLFATPHFGAGGNARPYLPGESLARQYADSSLPEVCSSLTFLSGADRPDIANGPLSYMTPYARHDAGEVNYSCMHNGKPARAYMLAVTYMYSVMWGQSLLAGCIAPAERLDDAKKTIRHMLENAHYDPAWARRQQASINSAAAALNRATLAQTKYSEDLRANAQRQMAEMNRQFNSFNDVLTQTATFTDASGAVYRNVPNTKSYHWRGTDGRIVETAGPNPPPGSGWTPLQKLPNQ
ncbi:MAG: hypothetical protein JO340_16795 [Acidobacteriaceae bacterium]|nr:hypothetical protein [Acidobacteriaceae bacterium]